MMFRHDCGEECLNTEISQTVLFRNRRRGRPERRIYQLLPPSGRAVIQSIFYKKYIHQPSHPVIFFPQKLGSTVL